MKFTKTLGLILIFSSLAQAIEPQNPLSLCERFLEGPDRTKCETRMTSLKPDWYLATVCNSDFDDKLFFDCVELSKLGSYSPEKLNDCLGDQYTDSARMTCVKAALTTPAKAFQKATPTGKAKTKAKK